jgi:hypothetical protein
VASSGCRLSSTFRDEVGTDEPHGSGPSIATGLRSSLCLMITLAEAPGRRGRRSACLAGAPAKLTLTGSK